MKYLPRFLSVLLLIGLTACDSKTTPDTKPKIQPKKTEILITAPVLFNNHWQFSRVEKPLSYQQAEAISTWEHVTLPHTTKIEPLVVNAQWQGEAWYKKTITSQPEWKNKRVYLDFEGAMNVADVYLNGRHIGQHFGGYLPFTVELTQHLQEDQNQLMVRLDNTDNTTTGPKPLKVLDFNMYGGIYRNTWLRVENTTHISNAIAANEVAGGGIFVQYPEVSKQRAKLNVKTHIKKERDAKNIAVSHTLFFNDKKINHTLIAFDAGTNTSAINEQVLTVANPKLWSPNTPNLYSLKTEVFENNLLVDVQTTQIGIRTFTFVNNQLHINGEKTFLRGVNRHQEYPYLGYALSNAAQYRDAEKIKAAGFDYVRLSHYPHATAFMKAADELGIVLVDAILGWQYSNDTPEFEKHVVQTCRDMIRRDRNHPSVLAWECSLNESWMEEPLIDLFHIAVHEEYPGNNVYSAGWQSYGYDIYLQARQHRLEHYETPKKPYLVSEYGDWEYYAMNAGLNQDRWGNLLQAERSSRQRLSDGETRLQQQAANITEAHNDNFTTPAFADGYWVMFDYNRGYADDLEASGVMSIERLPKYSYYFYQSQRDARASAGPLSDLHTSNGYMAYIASNWSEGSNLTFYVYSNADTVELKLNGNTISQATPSRQFKHLAHPPFQFTAPQFTPGELEAIAYVNKKPVARHKVVTPGKASSLKIHLEKTSIPPQTGVNDSVFVYATLQDDNLNPVRNNNVEVRFTTKGDIERIAPETTLTQNGTAATLIRIGKTLNGAKVQAAITIGSKTVTAELSL